MKFLAVFFSLFLVFSVCGAESKKFEMQKKPGFVGYIEAGSTVEIKSMNEASQTLNVVATADSDIGEMQVSFKGFERALGSNKKVVYLNKVEPLVGKTFVLKYNLVLPPIK